MHIAMNLKNTFSFVESKTEKKTMSVLSTGWWRFSDARSGMIKKKLEKYTVLSYRQRVLLHRYPSVRLSPTAVVFNNPLPKYLSLCFSLSAAVVSSFVSSALPSIVDCS